MTVRRTGIPEAPADDMDDHHHQHSSPQVLRPQPRRPGAFSLPSTSSNASPTIPDPAAVETPTTSIPSTPLLDPRSNTNLDVGGPAAANIPDFNRGLSGGAPQKSHSIMNLTSSTLFGIYSPTGYDANREEPSTPWGTGAQTPSRTTSVDVSAFKFYQPSQDTKLPQASTSAKGQTTRPAARSRNSQKHHRRRSVAVQATLLASRTAALFLFGLAYGEVITHLHDRGNIAPVKVDHIHRDTWEYLGFWGVAGATLGSLLPAIDGLERRLWRFSGDNDATRPATPERMDEKDAAEGSETEGPQTRGSLAAEWNPIVRSIGAFVGIAFAIVCPTNHSHRPFASVLTI